MPARQAGTIGIYSCPSIACGMRAKKTCEVRDPSAIITQQCSDCSTYGQRCGVLPAPIKVTALEQEQETLRGQLSTIQQELGAARASMQAAEERLAAQSQDLAQAQARSEGLQRELALNLEAKVCHPPCLPEGKTFCSHAATEHGLSAGHSGEGV